MTALKFAYENSFRQPESCATLFKRFMGTSTKFNFGGEELSPEECSAEIICNYTIDDVGSIDLEISAINESFYKNFMMTMKNFSGRAKSPPPR
ncbi:MAG: hypothetical protein SR3Q1_09395 [Quinella sp. 3Q1]|nr:hypothetical protein [Quinella sp. 3Q1]MBR6889084.1 hypothetical protein [Selenomonadaceae bacterium]